MEGDAVILGVDSTEPGVQTLLGNVAALRQTQSVIQERHLLLRRQHLNSLLTMSWCGRQEAVVTGEEEPHESKQMGVRVGPIVEGGLTELLLNV